MHIGILGTGNVATALAGRLGGAGHTVTLGSRSPEAKTGLLYPVVGFNAAIDDGDVVINATAGASILDIVGEVGAAVFGTKAVVDVANSITKDFALLYPNDSLGRRLQEALPRARVVKALNTVNVQVMTDPASLDDTSVFVSGNDTDAKRTTTDLIVDLGWHRSAVIDLGDIASAKGPEHYVLMFGALAQATRTRAFNIRVVY